MTALVGELRERERASVSYGPNAEYPWGVTPRGSRIRTGICFRCERVARRFGAEEAQWSASA
jgi:hypothetical protein